MKADPIIWLAVAIGVVFGMLVGGWNAFGKDGAVEYAREGQRWRNAKPRNQELASSSVEEPTAFGG